MYESVFLMTSFPSPLSAAEEEKYIAQIEIERKTSPNGKKSVNDFGTQAKEARKILIEHNMRLVAHIVKKYHACEKNPEDLLSIGTIGLIKAIDSFRPDKGIRLATYASRCIENEILMIFRSEKKNARDVFLFDSIGQDSDGNEISLIDILESEEEDLAQEFLHKEELQELSKRFNSCLTKKEQNLLRLRYGIGCEAMTQKQVGVIYGISRSYVSRLEKRALQKLKKALTYL